MQPDSGNRPIRSQAVNRTEILARNANKCRFSMKSSRTCGDSIQPTNQILHRGGSRAEFVARPDNDHLSPV